MNFDANRLAKLAGLSTDQSKRVLSEGQLQELGNQRKRDEQGDQDEGGHDLAELKDIEWLGEEDDDDWGSDEDEYKRRDGHRTGDVEGHYKDYELGENEDEELSGTTSSKDDLSKTHRDGEGELADPELDYDEDELVDENSVIEIDENMLKREILRMKAKRKKNLQENNFRKMIRSEIQQVIKSLSESDSDLYTDSSWLYGDNKPTLSKKGQIIRGIPGIGFKR